MKTARTLAVLVACFAAAMTMDAATWNKKTKVTFSAPFQIPAPNSSAKVLTLGPGTYVFKLVDSASNRHIVQVTNERENKVHSTILAIPDYRLNASSKTVMYFSERKAGAPVALKSWFYPGDNFGQRFVYPKVQAVQIAAATNQPVPSHSVEVIERTKYVSVPVYIQTPAKQEVAYSAATFEKHDSTDAHGEDGEAVKAPEPAATTAAAAAAAEKPAKLPKSASPVHMLGLMGLLALATSLLLRRASRELR